MELLFQRFSLKAYMAGATAAAQRNELLHSSGRVAVGANSFDTGVTTRAGFSAAPAGGKNLIRLRVAAHSW